MRSWKGVVRIIGDSWRHPRWPPAPRGRRAMVAGCWTLAQYRLALGAMARMTPDRAPRCDRRRRPRRRPAQGPRRRRRSATSRPRWAPPAASSTTTSRRWTMSSRRPSSGSPAEDLAATAALIARAGDPPRAHRRVPPGLRAGRGGLGLPALARRVGRGGPRPALAGDVPPPQPRPGTRSWSGTIRRGVADRRFTVRRSRAAAAWRILSLRRRPRPPGRRPRLDDQPRGDAALGHLGCRT